MIVSIATLSITTFQLTHSRGVRPSLRALRSVQPYFNSRTHVECDLPVVPTTENKEISTHALTWSATGNAFLGCIVYFYFNSRTHVECD